MLTSTASFWCPTRTHSYDRALVLIKSLNLPFLDVANWRLLFIIEGIPAILLGLFTFWALPNRPDQDKRFLTPEERELQIARMNRYSAKEAPFTMNKGMCISLTVKQNE